MHYPKKFITGLTASLACVCSAFAHLPAPAQIPTFTNVSVHDPAVVRAGSQFYVFGSHLAAASSPDLMQWTQIDSSMTTSPLINNGTPLAEFATAFNYSTVQDFWAPSVVKLNDGNYYYYYCTCQGSSPLSALGLAKASAVDGPYANVKLLLYSWGATPTMSPYNVNTMPNVVDPSVFYDNTGRLWMVYGSYSGGIFILELDNTVGAPTIGQPKVSGTYGKHLVGGNSARIEGPCIIYSPETQYYYLFMTFGGLDSAGGYNIRVGRSRQPDGPYLDPSGNDLATTNTTAASITNDTPLAPFGEKLMGNCQFLPVDGEPITTAQGYVSPGGVSVYYDSHTHQSFLVFHTRFVGGMDGNLEYHEVRVHQMYMNADGWPVAAPHRYAGELARRHDRDNVPGDYKLINHGKDTTTTVKTSSVVTLLPDGTLSGAATGSWFLYPHDQLTLTLDGVTYNGIFSTEWDNDQGAWVYAFSALSANGTAIWGSHPVTSSQPAHTVKLPDRLALFGVTNTFHLPIPHHERPEEPRTYSVTDGPAGLTIDRASGVVSWSPTLTQVDLPYPVTITTLNTAPEDHGQTQYTFTLTARSINVVRRVDLTFGSAGIAGLKDSSGILTGLTSRLPGTGASLPANDPNLKLNTADSTLELTSTQSDFNGQANLGISSMPAIKLSDLGFTGTEDFALTVSFKPITTLEFIDQVGVFVGASSNLLTRADTIVFSSTERHSCHTQNNVDYDGHFYGSGLDITNGMTITITRSADTWYYYINDLLWDPLSTPTFLDGRADLYAGFFAITPLNNNKKTIAVDSYSLVVATNEPQLTALEAWRIRYFGTLENKGIAADDADPDHDGITNLQEFLNGTNPLDETTCPPPHNDCR